MIQNHLPEIPFLPLRILVVGNFSPGQDAEEATTGMPLRVDKNSFNTVMSNVAGVVHLIVRDCLNEGSQDLRLKIPLEDLKAFRPDIVAQTIPELQPVLRLRETLDLYRAGKLDNDRLMAEVRRTPTDCAAVRRTIQTLTKALSRSGGRRSPQEKASASPRRSPQDDSIDSILDMVGVPGQPEAQPDVSKPTDELISAIIGHPGDSRQPRSGDVEVLLSELQENINRQLGEVFADPQFRRMESMWRGLRVLVDRTDFREPVRIEMLSCSLDDLPAALEGLVRLRADGGADGRPSAILAVYDLNQSAHHMEILYRVAEIACEEQIPLVTGASNALLGVANASEVASRSHAGSLFDVPGLVKWKSFREKETAQWVALVYNRFVLRPPYGELGISGNGFAVADRKPSTGEADPASPLWGCPVWAAGVLMVQSFAKTGWHTSLLGSENGPYMEDLPVSDVPGRGGAGLSCVEAVFPLDTLRDLSEHGLITLASRLDSDRIWLASAPTAVKYERFTDAGETQLSRQRASLPFQLMISRVIEHAEHFRSSLRGQTGDPLKVERWLTEAFGTLLGGGRRRGIGINVRFTGSFETPGLLDFRVSLDPEALGFAGVAPLEFQLKIPGV